jgi:hypothetical protein
MNASLADLRAVVDDLEAQCQWRYRVHLLASGEADVPASPDCRARAAELVAEQLALESDWFRKLQAYSHEPVSSYSAPGPVVARAEELAVPRRAPEQLRQRVHEACARLEERLLARSSHSLRETPSHESLEELDGLLEEARRLSAVPNLPAVLCLAPGAFADELPEIHRVALPSKAQLRKLSRFLELDQEDGWNPRGLMDTVRGWDEREACHCPVVEGMLLGAQLQWTCVPWRKIAGRLLAVQAAMVSPSRVDSDVEFLLTQLPVIVETETSKSQLVSSGEEHEARGWSLLSRDEVATQWFTLHPDAYGDTARGSSVSAAVFALTCDWKVLAAPLTFALGRLVHRVQVVAGERLLGGGYRVRVGGDGVAAFRNVTDSVEEGDSGVLREQWCELRVAEGNPLEGVEGMSDSESSSSQGGSMPEGMRSLATLLIELRGRPIGVSPSECCGIAERFRGVVMRRGDKSWDEKRRELFVVLEWNTMLRRLLECVHSLEAC